MQVINKTDNEQQVSVDVVEPAGASVTVLGPLRSVAPNTIAKGRLFVVVPDRLRSTENSTVRLVVRSGDQEVVRTDVSFVAPTKN